jgi:dTDP-4-amino-4,6-dideoxygalactose transaminase
LMVIEDAAQAIGGSIDSKMCGSFGAVGSTSFYPAKPLGCYGDGGAMFTNDDALAEQLRSFAFHGKGETQYDNVRVGINSRLDTLQAAILIEKLAILEDEMVARQAVAHRYAEGLGDIVKAARNLDGSRSAWAQYAIETPKRDGLKAHLGEKGIPSVIYYVKPLHSQIAYRDYPRTPTGLAASEELPKRILCLPMHPYLSEADQDRIIETIRNYIGSNSEHVAAA